MTAPSDADQARHADEAIRTFLLADARTGPNLRQASGVAASQPTAQSGDDDRAVIKVLPGTNQLEALPSDSGNRLIGIREIRELFSLGRTAAYELTHRDGFPAPVQLSSHAYRWWAREVAAFATALQREGPGSNGRSRSQAHQPTPRGEAAHLRITGKMRSARSRRIAP